MNIPLPKVGRVGCAVRTIVGAHGAPYKLKKLKEQLRKKYNGEVDIESYFGSSTR